MVSYMNIMNNLIMRAHLPEGLNPEDYGISAINHPMNRTRAQLYAYSLWVLSTPLSIQAHGKATLVLSVCRKASVIDVMIAISVIFAMCMIPASFVLFLIEERTSGSKHLQFVSGIHPVVYWVANFTWDMVSHQDQLSKSILASWKTLTF